MTHDPRTREQVYQSLKTGLTGRIAKLTNFTRRSFNYVWTQAFAEEISELELQVLASELSAYVNYAGGPITNEQLEELGFGNIEAEEVNKYMDDQQLDEYVKLVGVTRNPGSRSVGTVEFNTDVREDVQIPEGTVVTTRPDSDGEFFRFETVERLIVDQGDAIGTVQVQSVEPGDEYDVPANTITRLADPPIGVKGVSNPSATEGGEDIESNNELRERAKTAVTEQAGGGTVEGIKGFIRSNVEGVALGDVIIDEFLDVQPPYVDVIVDGGTDADALDAIETSRPAGIRHNLIRPSGISVSVDIVLLGQDIDQFFVQDQLEDYLLGLGLGETFYKDAVTRTVMRADDNILNLDNIEIDVKEVVNERHTYTTGTSVYRLDYSHDGGEVSVRDSNDNLFDEGADYQVVDDGVDGLADAIDWSIGGDSPNDGEDFFVDYDVNSRLQRVRDEVLDYQKDVQESFIFDNTDSDYTLLNVPFASDVTITDDSGDTYTSGNQFDMVSIPRQVVTDEFSYRSGRTEYRLDFTTEASTVSIEDEDGATYTNGTDYNVIDTTGDGLGDTIEWDTTNDTPPSDTNFTVTYKQQNGLAETIRWDLNQTDLPDDNESFTVEYDKQVYELKYMAEQPAETDTITDDSSDSYTKGTDWEFEDYAGDREFDSVRWTDRTVTPDDDERYFITYTNATNRKVDNDQKIEPGDITVTVR